MDYLLELARNPDLQQAITITGDEEKDLTPAARASLLELQRVSFLATQHPNAWVTEVLHAFYEHPDLAKAVWVNLRHTDRNRTVIASRDLTDQSQRSSSWLNSMQSWAARTWSGWRGVDQLREEDRPRKQFVEQFKDRPDQTVLEYSKALGGNRPEVERLCRETAAAPDPPKFLSDLMTAEATTGNERDARAQELLSDPELARKIARGKQVAIPFSMVQEAELVQICSVRGCVRPSASDSQMAAQSQNACDEISEAVARAKKRTNEAPTATCTVDAGTYPPAPRRHSARLALDLNLLGLAFSGGGIRSATFNLGVLQALSKIGLLKQVDYLSTVSGGGYIGSWLAGGFAATRTKSQRAAPSPPRRPCRKPRVVMTDIQRRLSPVRSPNPMDERDADRSGSSASTAITSTPRTGFLSCRHVDDDRDLCPEHAAEPGDHRLAVCRRRS